MENGAHVKTQKKMPLSFSMSERPRSRASPTAEEKLRYASVILAYLALGTNFLLRSQEALAIALTFSSFSLFAYLYQWSPSKHVLRTKANSEDLFFAATGVTLFSFFNIATKFIIPIAMTQSFSMALAMLWLLVAGLLGAYGLFLCFERATHHRDFIEQPENFLNDARLRDRYERLGNSVIVTSTFLAIDAPDLMLIISAIVFSSKLVASGVSRSLVGLHSVLLSFNSQTRKVSRQLWRLSRRVQILNLEEALWNRVLYVTHYKRGLSYLLLALAAGVSAIVYSYCIDFLSPNMGKLAVFLLLALPGVVAVYALKLPKGLVSTAKEAGRLRQVLIISSLTTPIVAIPLVYIEPHLVGYNGMANFSDLEFTGQFYGFVWLAIIPIVIALPLYSMIAAVEFEDYHSFIGRARLFAISPALATSLMAASAVLVSNLSFPSSLVIFVLYVSVACYFYPFIIFLAIRILRDVEHRTAKPMQQWIDKIRGPRWSSELLAVGLGSIFFPLFLFVGGHYPWVIFRYGLLFPHVFPVLFWIAGGVTTTSFVSPLSQRRRRLDRVRIGSAGSLGTMGAAISFVGTSGRLPYSLIIWAPWVIIIPVAYATGAMISVVVTDLLK